MVFWNSCLVDYFFAVSDVILYMDGESCFIRFWANQYY